MRAPGFRLAGLIVLLAMAVSAQAAPLDLKQVSADATWLGHLDFDAMRASSVMQKFMEQCKHRGHMEIARKMLGMDAEKDLHGITCYGSEIGRHKGVMILHARLDRGRVMGMAQLFPGHQVTDHGDYKLHSWQHKSRHGGESHMVAAAFHGEDWTVLASSIDELKQALDVLNGKAHGLTGDSPLAGRVPAGTTMLMRLEGVAGAKLPEKCKLARQTQSYRFVAGEHDGESFYRARATMTNEAVVGQLREVLEGLRALGQIHVGNNEVGRKMVDALRIKTDGKTLTVLWKAPASDVWTIIDAHRKIFEERMKAWMKHYRWGGHGHDWRDKWPKWDKCPKPQAPGKSEVPAEEDF